MRCVPAGCAGVACASVQLSERLLAPQFHRRRRWRGDTAQSIPAVEAVGGKAESFVDGRPRQQPNSGLWPTGVQRCACGCMLQRFESRHRQTARFREGSTECKFRPQNWRFPTRSRERLVKPVMHIAAEATQLRALTGRRVSRQGRTGARRRRHTVSVPTLHCAAASGPDYTTVNRNVALELVRLSSCRL